MTQPPLLFFRLMADRALKPGAVELCASKGDLDALSELVHGQPFAEFSADFRCFYGSVLAETLPPELLRALQDKGVRLLQGPAVLHSDEPTKPLLPPTADWLSGNWYFAQPSAHTAAHAASRALSLKLLQLVAADAETCEIEAVLRHDPVLAYHLLRLVNSLGMGVNRHISSFSQAILILGRHQLKRWLNLMLFAANRSDYRSAMLLARVAIRARSMELLAIAAGLDHLQQEQSFMAGMFSLLGTLFGMPLSEVLQPLQLNDSLYQAVLLEEGKLGALLITVKDAEQVNQDSLLGRLEALGISNDQFNQINLEAHQWMLEVIHDKQEAVDA